MKKILLVLIFIFIKLSAVDFMTVAKNFLSYENQNSTTILSSQELKKSGKVVGYLYNLEPSGYIIIPNTTLASPIKAFSFGRNYDNLPPNYKDFLINELYQYKLLERTNILAKTLDDSISKRWDFLETFSPNDNSRVLKNYLPDTYLLDSTWNQTYPYNKTFPKVNNNLTVAGCVAVAQAQLMRYYKYPTYGVGSSSYLATIYDYSNQYYFDNPAYTIMLKSIYNKPYNWDIMPSSLLGAKEYQIDEVSYLLRDLTILNRAKIGVDQTAAILNIPGFIEHFGYSSNMTEITTNDLNREDFFNILKSQIDLEQPVLLSFSAHMTVADGYKNDYSGEYIHINLGWGEGVNDFYNLDSTSILVNDSTSLNTSPLSMVYNIKPCSKEVGDCYTNLEDSDTNTNNSISGSFLNPLDEDKYQLYLSGPTSISVSKGWFFINIYDSNNTFFKTITIDTLPYNTTIDFPTGLYTVIISLSDHSNSSYYPLENDNQEYNLNFQTQDIDTQTKEEIDSSLKKPIIFDMEFNDIVLGPEEKKIRINAYDEDSNLTFNVFTTKNITASFEKNILTLKANEFYTLNNLSISIQSDDDSIIKNNKILTYPEDFKFGTYFTLRGTFDSQDDLDSYKNILEGECSIRGLNGYIVQAFYTRANGISTMNNTTIFTPNLVRNFYTIEASLSENPYDNSGGYYPYEPENPHNYYTLFINCPQATKNVEDIIPLLDRNIVVETNISTPIYTQNIPQNWSLLSLPVDINLTEDEIKEKFSNSLIIWTYNKNKWNAIGINSNIQNILNDQNITKIGNLGSKVGFWVYTQNNSYDINYTNTISKTVPTLDNSLNKWELLGTTLDLNTSSFLKDNNLKSIWTYNDSKWYAISSDPNIQSIYDMHNIDSIDTIKRGTGFWIERW